MVKNLPANAGDTRDAGLIPGLGRSPGEGNGNPLQYPCLGNPTDRGTWRAAAHGATKSPTLLCMYTHTQKFQSFLNFCKNFFFFKVFSDIQAMFGRIAMLPILSLLIQAYNIFLVTWIMFNASQQYFIFYFILLTYR